MVLPLTNLTPACVSGSNEHFGRKKCEHFEQSGGEEMFSNEHFWWRGGNIEEMFARQTSHGCTGAYCTHLIDYLSHSQNEGKHEEDNLSTFFN